MDAWVDGYTEARKKERGSDSSGRHRIHTLVHDRVLSVCLLPLMCEMIRIHTGDTEVLDVLIKAGATVDASSSQNGSPLLWAVSTSKEEPVNTLLQAGADPNAVNARGASALAMAAGSGKAGILKALLQAGRQNITGGRGRHHRSARCSQLRRHRCHRAAPRGGLQGTESPGCGAVGCSLHPVRNHDRTVLSCTNELWKGRGAPEAGDQAGWSVCQGMGEATGRRVGARGRAQGRQLAGRQSSEDGE